MQVGPLTFSQDSTILTAARTFPACYLGRILSRCLNTDFGSLRWTLANFTNVTSYLCKSAGRPLTRGQWARDVPGLPYKNICP